MAPDVEPPDGEGPDGAEVPEGVAGEPEIGVGARQREVRELGGQPFAEPDRGLRGVDGEGEQGPGQEARERAGDRDEKALRAMVREGLEALDRDEGEYEEPAAREERRGDDGQTCCETCGEGAGNGAPDAEREAVEAQRGHREERRVGKRLVLAGEDAEGCDEEQYGDVGDDAAVVARTRLAAEGEGDGLRLRASGEVPGAVPKGGRGEREEKARGEAHRGDVAHESREAAEGDDDGGEPARERTRLRDRRVGHHGHEPGGCAAVKHGGGRAEAQCVAKRPEPCRPETAEGEDGQKREKAPARELAGGFLGHFDGSGSLAEHGGLLS